MSRGLKAEKKLLEGAIEYWKGFEDGIEWSRKTLSELIDNKEIIDLIRDKHLEIDIILEDYNKRILGIKTKKNEQKPKGRNKNERRNKRN